MLENWKVYLYWGIGIIVLISFLYIYFKTLSDSQRRDFNNFMKNYWFWVIVVPGIIFFGKHLGYWPQDDLMNEKKFIYPLLSGLIILFVGGFFSVSRERSTSFLSPNLFGSCAYYKETEDYLVGSLDSINSHGVPGDSLGKRTFVCEKRFVIRSDKKNKSTSDFICQVKFDKIDSIDELPKEAKKLLSKNSKFNKDNIYYGRKKQDFKISNLSGEDLEKEKRELSETITHLKSQTEEFMKDHEHTLKNEQSLAALMKGIKLTTNPSKNNYSHIKEEVDNENVK